MAEKNSVDTPGSRAAGPTAKSAEPPGPSTVGPDGAPAAVTPSAAGVTAPGGTLVLEAIGLAGTQRPVPSSARSPLDSAPGPDRLLPVVAGGGSTTVCLPRLPFSAAP